MVASPRCSSTWRAEHRPCSTTRRHSSVCLGARRHCGSLRRRCSVLEMLDDRRFEGARGFRKDSQRKSHTSATLWETGTGWSTRLDRGAVNTRVRAVCDNGSLTTVGVKCRAENEKPDAGYDVASLYNSLRFTAYLCRQKAVALSGGLELNCAGKAHVMSSRKY